MMTTNNNNVILSSFNNDLPSSVGTSKNRGSNLIFKIKNIINGKFAQRASKEYNNLVNEFSYEVTPYGVKYSKFTKQLLACHNSSAFGNFHNLMHDNTLSAYSILTESLINDILNLSVHFDNFEDVWEALVALPQYGTWLFHFDDKVSVIYKTCVSINSKLTNNRRKTIFCELVGIEPNPGPESVERASFLKRLQILDLISQKRIDKQIKNNIDDARRTKRGYIPEGMFNVGLDDHSKMFLEHLVSELKTLATNFKIPVSFKLDAPDFIVNFLSWLSGASKVVIDIAKTMIFLHLQWFPQKVHEFLSNIISLYLGPVDEFVDAQTYEAEGGLSSSFLALFLYKDSIKKYISEGNWVRFVDTISSLGKMAKSADGSFAFLTTMLRETVIFLNQTFNLGLPIASEDAYLVEVEGKLNSLVAEMRDGIKDEYRFADRVFLLHSEIEEMAYTTKNPPPAHVKDKLVYMLKKFTPIVNYVERSVNPGDGPRVEPLAILLAGPTGAGKSSLTMPFLLALLGNIIPEDQKEEFLKKGNHNKFIFFRNTENEFWEGHKRHKVAIVYDDYGQLKDSTNAPSGDAFEIIRLKNTAPYHLHFASLDEKQKNYAAPKVIFATTNMSKLYFESINCNKAVSRRFDLSYVQTPKLEFCTSDSPRDPMMRVLDIDKVRKFCPYDPNDPMSYLSLDVIEYIEWDFAYGKARENGNVLSFRELLKLSISRMKEIEGKGNVMLNYHENMKTFKPEGATKDDNNKEFLDALETSETSLLPRMYKWIYSSLAYYGTALPKLTEEDMVYIKTYCMVVISINGGVMLANQLQRLVNWFKGEPHAGESNYSNRGERVLKNPIKIKVRGKTRSTRGVMNKSSSAKYANEANVPNLDFHLSMIKKNTYTVKALGVPMGYATFVNGNIFVMPRHFISYIDQHLNDAYDTDNGDFRNEPILMQFIDTYTGMVSFTLEYECDFNVIDEDDNIDVCYCAVTTRKIRMHKSIINHFPTAKELSIVDRRNNCFMVVHRSSPIFLNVETYHSAPVEYKDALGETLYSSSVHYKAPTLKGDCGSMLVLNDTRLSRPLIVAMHTAGCSDSYGGHTCVGVTITQDALQEVADSWVSSFETEMVEDISYKQDVKGVKNFDTFPTVMNLEQPRMPTETKITRSEFHGKLWDIGCKPAILKKFLKDGELIDPSKKARDKYCHNEIYIDSDNLAEAEHYVSNTLLKFKSDHDPKVLSFDEAVAGIDGEEYIDSINRSTSPGYPYILEKNALKGKKAWFGDGDEFNLSNEKCDALRERVNYVLQSAKEGKREMHIFLDCLKDERRPIEKVDSGKTRQINACPMDLSIAIKMYFGDFSAYIMKNRIHNGTALGINPGTEWCALARHLQATPNHVLTAGDYSSYDGKINVAFGNAFLRIVEKYYVNSTKEDRIVRQILFQEIINSRHLADGVVYEMIGGNPSGQPLTSIYNSICNMLMIIYVGVCMCALLELCLEDVLKDVRVITYGDDNGISYSPKYNNVWGQKVLTREMPRLCGMDYTIETKDGKEAEMRKLTEIQFLKRHFRKDEFSEWVAPLDMSVLRETLNWSKKGSSQADLEMRVECVLSEFAAWGAETYNKYGPKICRVSQETLNYSPLNCDYRTAKRSCMMLEA